MKHFNLTERAAADVTEICQYIADRNPRAALEFHERLMRACQRAADQPHSGRERPELGRDVRSVGEGNYLVLYCPTATGATIARVLHGARELPAAFFVE